MTAQLIDPNSAEFRETMYALDDAVAFIGALARQLSAASYGDASFFNERMLAIRQVSASCEKLLNILRHYGADSSLRLSLQYPLVRHELKRLRNSFRSGDGFSEVDAVKISA